MSSFLDNTPTFLTFATLAAGSDNFHALAQAKPLLLQAVSCGAVLMGANTYIGNGPNFMVKSIADHQKVHTPGFLGFLWKYSLPIMIPMLALVWLLFFRSTTQ